MLVIGEKINATNSAVAEAIARRDDEFIARLASSQDAGGADFIDVNAGSGHGPLQDDATSMAWLVKTVQSATNKPLAIDSDSPRVIEAALGQYRGEQLIINSVTAEPARLEPIGSLAAERHAWLVALAMGAEGIPDTSEKRLAACDTIMAGLLRLGIEPEQVLFDPLVLPIGVDSTQGLVTLKTIEQIKARHPAARTMMGLSNISYGLPNRKLINLAFLQMAAYAGLDAVILDPLDARTMSLVKVADMLNGKDTLCKAYLRAHRKGDIVN
ncbi:MAG TPA: dihydropteroate synthase [Dehalococcoidia bacterium]|nr:dihydropteroate synthase [Dehalococcoidia bacterium]